MPAEPLLNEPALIYALDPSIAIPEDELGSVFGLCVVACYDRKVEREFFIDVLNKAMNGVRLLRGLNAELTMYQGCSLPAEDNAKKLFNDMAMLSLKEIKVIRAALLEKMKLVHECRTDPKQVS
jgi:hypothetical protein